MNQCERCAYFAYDEDYDDSICEADMDEDDYARLISSRGACPFFRDGDEYKVVRRQM